MKKSIILGMAALAIFGMASCDNKAEKTTADTMAPAVEEPVNPITSAVDTVTASFLDLLTLDEGTKRDSVIYTTPTGLRYRIVKEGTGAAPNARSYVEVNYEGRNLNGKIFDSSYKRNQSIEFPLQQVIPGWTEGLQYMKEGAIYEFYIPAHLAYGDRQMGEDIAPNSDLLFKVELIKVK